MMSGDDFKFEGLLKESLQELHTHTLNSATAQQPQDFDNAMDGTTVRTQPAKTARFNRSSLVAGAASIVLIIGLAVPALISWQGGSGADTASNIKTANDPQRTTPTTKADSDKTPGNNDVTTSVPETNPDGTPADPGNDKDEDKNKDGLVTTTTQPAQGSTTTTTTPQQAPAAPTGFYAYTTEKYEHVWKIKFTWQPSLTPGVSYCVGFTSAVAQGCLYNPSLTATWYNFEVSPGFTEEHTWYLTAVTPEGVVSNVVSYTYSAPA